MAVSKDSRKAKRPTAKQTGDVGVPNPDDFRNKADDVIPETDDAQKAYKRQIEAKSAKDEAKAKVERVDASPDAGETPSGAALKATAGISNDAERGEAYETAKAAARRGTLPPDDVAEAID